MKNAFILYKYVFFWCIYVDFMHFDMLDKVELNRYELVFFIIME